MLLLCCSYVALIGNGTYNGPTTDVQRTYSKTKEAHIHHEYAPLQSYTLIFETLIILMNHLYCYSY